MLIRRWPWRVGEAANEASILHIVTGGHTDPVTGTDCHWNVFRVCNTTRMETDAVGKLLIDKYGKRWFFITPDYAFGHTLQQGFEANLKKYGGTEVGATLTPLGTTDFSSYLIDAAATNPDVLINLTAGQDAVNSLKQIVQFGLNKKFHVAGAQQELEVLEGLPPDARIGTWVFEWYWAQPDVPHVKEFVADIRKINNGKVPTARHWFGFAATWTCALVANQEKTLDPVKLAHALENFTLPPEVALMPDKVFYRGGDHQLMPDLLRRARSGKRTRAGRPISCRFDCQRGRCSTSSFRDRLSPQMALGLNVDRARSSVCSLAVRR